MTDIPTITQEEAVEVRARLCVLLRGRDGADFDGEVHLTSAEAREVIAAPSPNMDHAVGGVREPLGDEGPSLKAEAEFAKRQPERAGVIRRALAMYRFDTVSDQHRAHEVARIVLGLIDTPPVNQDAVREALERLVRSNIATMQEQVRRCERWGKSHAELDIAIKESRAALATPPVDQDAVRDDGDLAGYQMAFYELAKIMGIGARVAAPGHVWRTEMLPRLLATLTTPPLDNTGLDAATGWQPIETAPKDGTVIDLWVLWPADGDEPAEARRQADANWNECASDWQIDHFHLSQYTAKPYATHWRAKPAAPALASGDRS